MSSHEMSSGRAVMSGPPTPRRYLRGPRVQGTKHTQCSVPTGAVRGPAGADRPMSKLVLSSPRVGTTKTHGRTPPTTPRPSRPLASELQEAQGWPLPPLFPFRFSSHGQRHGSGPKPAAKRRRPRMTDYVVFRLWGPAGTSSAQLSPRAREPDCSHTKKRWRAVTTQRRPGQGTASRRALHNLAGQRPRPPLCKHQRASIGRPPGLSDT